MGVRGLLNLRFLRSSLLFWGERFFKQRGYFGEGFFNLTHKFRFETYSKLNSHIHQHEAITSRHQQFAEVCYHHHFLSVIWLPKEQLWATDKERVHSPEFYHCLYLIHWETRNDVGFQSQVESINGIQAGNLSIMKVIDNPRCATLSILILLYIISSSDLTLKLYLILKFQKFLFYKVFC